MVVVIQDTREKIPWNFIPYSLCKGQLTKPLSAGDYTLDGYPDLICIERKKSASELANNCGKKYPQFKREMEKLTKYRFRYVVCEFTEEQLLIYPKGSKLPKRVLSQLRISGKFLHKRVNEIQDFYGVEFVFCENRYEAKDTTMKLFLEAKDIYDKENRQSINFRTIR